MAGDVAQSGKNPCIASDLEAGGFSRLVFPHYDHTVYSVSWIAVFAGKPTGASEAPVLCSICDAVWIQSGLNVLQGTGAGWMDSGCDKWIVGYRLLYLV